MFYFTSKTLLSNFISILYPKSFILCRKAAYNGIRLEIYTPFDFQPIKQKTQNYRQFIKHHKLHVQKLKRT